MPIVNITRDELGNLAFDPPSVTLDPTGDWVSWANLDERDEHQPTRQGKPADYWLSEPLPRFEKGQPAATSPPVTLTPAASSDPIPYVDALHPDDAVGTIEIAPDTTQGGTE